MSYLRFRSALYCFKILLLILIADGCESNSTNPLGPQGFDIRYGWGFINCSQNDLENVTLFEQRLGGLQYVGAAGWLGHAESLDNLGAKLYEYPGAPRCIPGFLIIKWSLGKELFSQTVDFRGTIKDPCEFKGTVYFYYQHRAWHAMPLTKEQEFQYAAQGLPRFPKLAFENVEITD